MRIRNAVLAMLCACATQQLVMAHPGHTVQPEAPHSLTHYLAHPDHLIQWFVIAVVIACAIVMLRGIKRPAPAYARNRKHN